MNTQHLAIAGTLSTMSAHQELSVTMGWVVGGLVMNLENILMSLIRDVNQI